jgi:hypothetical protein
VFRAFPLLALICALACGIPDPAPPDGGTACAAQNDCGWSIGRVCVDGRCVDGCRGNQDCRPDQACTENGSGTIGACRPLPLRVLGLPGAAAIGGAGLVPAALFLGPGDVLTPERILVTLIAAAGALGLFALLVRRLGTRAAVVVAAVSYAAAAMRAIADRDTKINGWDVAAAALDELDRQLQAAGQRALNPAERHAVNAAIRQLPLDAPVRQPGLADLRPARPVK